MLIDPARAAEVNFTPAFVRSDFTYLVPAGSAVEVASLVGGPPLANFCRTAYWTAKQ
jgi:hypothetical protein